MQIIITIIAAVFVFGIIIFIHELGHFLAARLSGIKVNEFAIGMGPTILKMKRKDTVYAIRLFPIGGFVSMEGEDEDSDEIGSFGKAPVGNRILTVAMGAIFNLILGFFLMMTLTIWSGAIATTTIHSFEENASSYETGLEVDDKIISINGRRMYNIDDILYELFRVKEGKADFIVERDGERVEVSGVTFETFYNEEADIDQIVLDFKVYAVEKTFFNVIRESFYATISMVKLVFVSVVDLVTGNVPINQLAGPVGIVNVISDAVVNGVKNIIYIMALLTINLGVMNLLPLPALDGGRLVFLIFEAITKRKLNPKYEGYIHAGGLILLLTLMIFVTYNDVTKLFMG